MAVIQIKEEADRLALVAFSDSGVINAAAGEQNTAVNVGAGAGEVFRSKEGVNLNLRTVKGINGIDVVTDDHEVVVDGAPLQAALGEDNVGLNVGAAAGEVYRDKTGVILNLRTLKGLNGISVVTVDDEVEIDGIALQSALGEDNVGANVGIGPGQLYRDKSGVALNLRTLKGAGGIAVTIDGDEVEIDGSSLVDLPGGADGRFQYNDGGSFGGAAEVAYDDVVDKFLIGPSPESVFAPYTKAVVSQSSYHNASVSNNAALVLEAEADAAAGRDAETLHCIAYTDGGRSAIGFVSRPIRRGGDAGGIYGGIITAIGSGGANIGLSLATLGGTSNVALEVIAGDVRFWMAQAIRTASNNAAALAFRGTGADVLVIDTTTGNEAAVFPSALKHTGTKVGFYGAAPVVQPTVTGAKGGNAALSSLLTALASIGVVIDSTT